MSNFTDDDIKKLIEIAETRGEKDPYSAINKKSGALGKFQLLEKFHKDPIEKRYNIPFQDIVKYPEYQEDYFSNVLLPQYKKSTSKIKKSIPESENIDEMTLTAMQQLGAGNVEKYLSGEANENIKKQMEYFQNISDEYKKQKEQEHKNNFLKVKKRISR